MRTHWFRALEPKPSPTHLGSLASTIFHHFIASDSGHESLQSLKRIHGLMPYFMFKGILRISNPVAMIRGEWYIDGSRLSDDVEY